MARRGDRGRKAAPQLEVAITGYGPGGEAVGRAPGERRPVIIAAGAVPGDRLLVALEHEGRAAVFGRSVRVLEAARDRVAPRCPIVALCGGCPWQALAYPAQLERKHQDLVRAVRALPALREVPISAVRPLAQDAPYGYRTKIQMPVSGRAGALRVGFFRPGTHEVVDVLRAGGCAVQHPEGNRIVSEAVAVLDAARVEPYDERRHAGVLRYILLRLDPGGARAALTLVLRTDRLPGGGRLIERLARIRGVSGVFVNVQPARGNVVLGRRTERQAGRDRVLVEIAGRRFLLSPTAFFQTNAAGAALLVERVRERLRGPYRTLVDLYCGVGLFARFLADRADRVIGVEESRAAIEDAEAGAALARETRVAFVAAPVEAFVRGAGPADAVVVDPPRAGCGAPLLEALAARLRPREIAYVSCSPESLIRDLAALARLGYRTRAIEPVDMFPHTPHLECVATLERSAGRP